MKTMICSILSGIAMMFHWLGESLDLLVLMIGGEETESLSEEDEFDPEDEPDLASSVLSPHQDEDGYIKPSSAEAEQIIRSILTQNISEGAEAKNLVVGIMGLCRTLNTMASAALQSSDNKSICCEASGVIAITSTCERMVRSLTGFRFVENYKFLGGDDFDDED